MREALNTIDRDLLTPPAQKELRRYASPSMNFCRNFRLGIVRDLAGLNFVVGLRDDESEHESDIDPEQLHQDASLPLHVR